MCDDDVEEKEGAVELDQSVNDSAASGASFHSFRQASDLDEKLQGNAMAQEEAFNHDGRENCMPNSQQAATISMPQSLRRLFAEDRAVMLE